MAFFLFNLSTRVLTLMFINVSVRSILAWSASGFSPLVFYWKCFFSASSLSLLSFNLTVGAYKQLHVQHYLTRQNCFPLLLQLAVCCIACIFTFGEHTHDLVFLFRITTHEHVSVQVCMQTCTGCMLSCSHEDSNVLRDADEERCMSCNRCSPLNS